MGEGEGWSQREELEDEKSREGERTDGGERKVEWLVSGLDGTRGSERENREPYWSDKIAKPVFRSPVSFSFWLR